MLLRNDPDVEAANCCYEMIHIASLSGRGMCANFSFPMAGNKGGGGETTPFSTVHTVWASYAVYIRGCAVNVRMLERLTAVAK